MYGDLELAMVQRADGTRVLRPEAVRMQAQRVQKWAVVAETCQSCSSLPAVRLIAQVPLCGRCFAQRQERFGLPVFEAAGLPPRSGRAEPEPSATELHGYAIVFNSRSVELFGFFEYIRPSAADRLEAEKPDLRALWNHDSAETIGRVSAGTLGVQKRTKGVWSETVPPKWASRHVESVERRDITGMSFAFETITDNWWLEDGIPQREILDMNVFEVSLVSFPAYPATTMKVVGAPERQARRRDVQRLRLAQ